MEGELGTGKARQPGPPGYRVGRSLQQAPPQVTMEIGGSPIIFSLQEKKAKLPGLLNVPEQVDTTGE